MVVAVHPVFGHATYLIERIEDVAVKQIGVLGPADPLDVGILGGLASSDQFEMDALTLGPAIHGPPRELRPRIGTNRS